MKTWIVLLALLPVGAGAEIYKCSDGSGIDTFTDNPKSVTGKKCVSMNLDSLSVIPAPKPRPSAPRTESKKPDTTPAEFPRVDGATQKKRDDKRKQILTDELNTEKALLTKAQQALAEGEAVRLGDERNNYQKYLDRVARLRDAVKAHQKNIEELNKELAKP
jgi:hypothetical protein